MLGKDVREIDSWGFDCYTRRNIHDGVYHSADMQHLGMGAFNIYTWLRRRDLIKTCSVTCSCAGVWGIWRVQACHRPRGPAEA